MTPLEQSLCDLLSEALPMLRRAAHCECCAGPEADELIEEIERHLKDAPFFYK